MEITVNNIKGNNKLPKNLPHTINSNGTCYSILRESGKFGDGAWWLFQENYFDLQELKDELALLCDDFNLRAYYDGVLIWESFATSRGEAYFDSFFKTLK